ncbi:MAG: lysylphosphatidylglycerol synthase transmembrane domain-containing protein, partial [Mangrovicoccus sp.]
MAKAKAAQLGVGVWGRSLVAPILSCALIFSLSKSFGVTDLAAVKDSFSAVAPWQWLAAAVMTAISYWALGRYDATCHKWMKTGIHDRRATTAGAAALALSQTLGIGIITGALARWRMLPDLSLKRALLLSTNVAATFMAGWAVITVISLIFLANPLPGPDWLPLAMVAPALFLAALRPMGRLSWGNRFGLDAQRALMLCLYAGLDMLAAGIVVFVLIAPEAQPSLQAFLPAFLLALGAGLLSGTPGGVGAFELSLLALAPSEDPAALVAAILGYRLIYFALPAVIGAGIMVRRPSLGEDGQRPFVIETEEDGSFPKEVDDLLSHSSWAEAGLARQRDFGLLWCPKARSGGVVGMAG